MKMFSTATAHFTNLSSAIKFYKPYGLTVKEVKAKLSNGDISIGPPTIGPSEKLGINAEGRYIVKSF